jgi:hypothetical protein
MAQDCGSPDGIGQTTDFQLTEAEIQPLTEAEIQAINEFEAQMESARRPIRAARSRITGAVYQYPRLARLARPRPTPFLDRLVTRKDLQIAKNVLALVVAWRRLTEDDSYLSSWMTLDMKTDLLLLRGVDAELSHQLPPPANALWACRVARKLIDHMEVEASHTALCRMDEEEEADPEDASDDARDAAQDS